MFSMWPLHLISHLVSQHDSSYYDSYSSHIKIVSFHAKKKTIFVCFLDGTFILNEHCLAHEFKHSTAYMYPSIHLKKIIPFDAHYIDSHHSINFIAFWCMCVFAVDSNAICHFCINSKYIK